MTEIIEGDLNKRGKKGTSVKSDPGGARVPKGPDIPIEDTAMFDTRFNRRRAIDRLIQDTTEVIPGTGPKKPRTSPKK